MTSNIEMNFESEGKATGEVSHPWGQKVMKNENLEDEILEPPASSPGVSGVILEHFGAQLRKIMTRRAYSCISS